MLHWWNLFVRAMLAEGLLLFSRFSLAGFFESVEGGAPSTHDAAEHNSIIYNMLVGSSQLGWRFVTRWCSLSRCASPLRRHYRTVCIVIMVLELDDVMVVAGSRRKTTVGTDGGAAAGHGMLFVVTTRRSLLLICRPKECLLTPTRGLRFMSFAFRG